jgi:hypothetical protein
LASQFSLATFGSSVDNSRKSTEFPNKVSEYNLSALFTLTVGSGVNPSTGDYLIPQTTASNPYAMKIEIINHFTADGREYIEWSLWDGPDGIDHAHGYASDLVQAFSKIFEWRERIAADYNDLNTNNETLD